MTEPDAAGFWEDRYAGPDQIWSGNPNAALVATVSDLPAGTVLDLGCGEGGDSVWLAERGWQVTAVDISATAVGRGRARAAARGIPDGRIHWNVEDLTAWRPSGAYELVSACFLHSPVEFDRTAVLQRAAGAVVHGGHLLIVGHAEFPPWAEDHGHAEHHLLGPAEEIAALQLDGNGWDTVVSEVRPRQATGPAGEQATLLDTVVFLSRRLPNAI